MRIFDLKGWKQLQSYTLAKPSTTMPSMLSRATLVPCLDSRW